MPDDWADEEFIRGWDADSARGNPVRPEQLDILISILRDAYVPGDTILDVGLGSGLVEEALFPRVPEAQVVGIDSSVPMSELARRRLRAWQDRYLLVMHDLRQVGTLRLPERRYRLAFSVQTIHNLEDEYKPPLLRFVHEVLDGGGLFLLQDRIAIDTPGLFDVYRSAWERLSRLHGTTVTEGKTPEDHARKLVAGGDHPAGLEQHLRWLREAGFDAACIHLHANRALFAARKPS